MANYVKGVERGRSGVVSIDSDSETLVAVVIADNRYYSPTQIAYTPGLPTVGGWFDFLGYVRIDLILESIDCVQDERNPFVWRCTLTYNSKPSGDQSNPDPGNPAYRENPLLKPVDLQIGSRSINRVVDTAFAVAGALSTITDDMSEDNQFICVRNSAKQKFTDPPLEEELHIRTYNFTKNVAISDQLYIEEQYSDDCINTDAVTIAGRLCEVATLRMPPPRFQIARGGPQGSYWVGSFEVHYKRGTWIREILDRGSLDKDGKPWTGAAIYGNEMHNLDGEGFFKAANTDPESIYVRTLRSRPFSPLLQYWSQ